MYSVPIDILRLAGGGSSGGVESGSGGVEFAGWGGEMRGECGVVEILRRTGKRDERERKEN